MVEPKLFHVSYSDNMGQHYSFLTVGVDMDDVTAKIISKDQSGHDIVTVDWYEVDEVDGHEIFVSGLEDE